MTSEALRQLIPEYLAGRLAAEESQFFEAELRTNAELQIEVEELRAAWQGLGLIPAPQPSAAMRASFYQRLHDLQSGRAPAVRGGFAWWKPGLSGLVRQIAVVLALFCAGLYVGRVSMGLGGRAPGGENAQLQAQIQSLRETVALSLIDRQSPASRLQAVSWGSQVEHPDGDLLSALISTLEHDPNTNVRLAALDALEKFSAEAPVRQGMVNALAHQDSPLVQIALIDALVHMREKTAAGEFRKLSTEADANAAVRQRARWALQTLKF
jgi:hypothetical protein